MQKQSSYMFRGLGLALAALAVAATSASAQGNNKKAPAKGAARPPAAAPAPPPAPMPQITAAGIRVTGLGLGANGTELKPFNESPGTTIALAIQAPKGSGIVDIDDDASKLDAVSDDKGTSLMEEGRVGPFPKISEDGTAGLAEVEVRARPSAGASSVTVQGTLGLKLAGGSKPQRAANVKIANDQTFKIGATVLTISEVTVEEESTRFTVKLPRSLLTTIRETRFFDAKNAPIEANRRGSGYFNDKAELSLEAKTKDKVFTIEFDVWQNVRDVKVPFKVEVGFGFAAGPRTVSTDVMPGPAPAAEPEKPEGPPPAIGPSEGAASVEAVMKQVQTAAAAGKGAAMLSVVYPTDRVQYAQIVAMSLAMMPMKEMSNEKASEAIQKDLDAFFEKQTLKPPFMREADDLFKGIDVNKFVTDALAFLKSHAKKGESPTEGVLPQGKLTDVTVDGDRATAKVGDATLSFSKISGRWFWRMK